MDAQATILLGKAIGAGLAMIGAAGGGIGIGLAVGGAVQAMGRNPDHTPTIQTNMIPRRRLCRGSRYLRLGCLADHPLRTELVAQE